jgi:hypothetical protein
MHALLLGVALLAAPINDDRRTLLIIDGLALGAATASLALAGPNSSAQKGASAALGALAVGAFLLDGPIYHWSHGYPGRGFGSLGIRLALPIAGAALGFAIACSGAYCWGNSNEQHLPQASNVPPLVGLTLGIAAAAAADAWWLVDEDEARVSVVPAPRGLALRARF